MKIAQLRKMDISNGDGIGISIWAQGCCYRCKGCHNQETWSFKGGKEWSDKDKLRMIEYLYKNRYIKRLSILGGEPFLPQNIDSIKEIVLTVKKLFPYIKIYIWTGTTFENLFAAANNHLEQCDDDIFLSLGWTQDNCKDLWVILNHIDYLIDGRFIQEKKDLTLKWRGSSNQRIIDMPRTLKQKRL